MFETQLLSQALDMKFGVIGGGLLGLTLSHRLARLGHQVSLFESSYKLGGLAESWTLGDVEWDRFYHVILASDSALRDLLKEVDLEKEIRWGMPKTGFFINGSIHPFSGPIDLLRFPALRFIDKLRLGLIMLVASRIRDGAALENVKVSDWLIKWSGQRAFENFWLPLLRAKLSDNYKITSAAFIWATIRRLYAAKQAGIQERFGYVKGGYKSIVLALTGLLEKESVAIRVGTNAARIEQVGSGTVIHFADGSQESVDRVVLTVPGPVAASLCKWMTGAEKSSLQNIRYQGIVCASMLLTKPLGLYYVTNIGDQTIPFTGLIEMSALLENEDFKEQALIYLPRYVASDDPVLLASDEQIRRDCIAGLQQMYPAFEEKDIRAFRVARVPHVFAIPTLGYSKHLPPLETSRRGVFVLNSANILNATLNVNETIRLVDQNLSKLVA